MTSQKKEGKEIIESWKDNRIKVFFLTSGYTLGMIAILAIGGYYLDQYFETKPLLFISGLALGFPLTQVLIYRKFKKFAKKELKK